MKKCKNCSNLNTDDSKFCEECGHKLEEVSSTFATNNCVVCGESNDIGSKFCESCGTSLQLETKKDIDKNLKKESCLKCGTQRENDALFCEECGFSYSQKEIEITQEKNSIPKPNNMSRQQMEPVKRIPRKPKKKMGLTTKILIGFLAVLLIGSGVSYKFLEKKYSKENQIKDILTAISQNDSTFLTSHMTTDDPTLKITKEVIEPMMTYFEENKEALNDLSNSFNQDNEYIGLSIKEEGKKALFFPEYKLSVTPVYTTVTSNTKDSKIEMNNKKLFITDSNDFQQKIGPLVPGTYHFKASLKDKKEISESTLSILPVNDDSAEKNLVDLSFIKVEVPVSSNMKDSIIFINDKEVGTVGNEQTKVGPFLWEEDLSVYLVNKTESGEIKTEPQTVKKEDLIKENDTLYSAPSLRFKFELAGNRDVERGLNLFYDDFSKVVSASSDYNSSEFASNYFENGDKNEAFTGINDYINWCRDRSAKKEYEGVRFSVKVASIDPISDDTYKIKYNVEYKTTYPYATRKDMRIEGFDYSNVTIKLEMDQNDYQVKSFKFIDMGDGGKKVKDNGANE